MSTIRRNTLWVGAGIILLLLVGVAAYFNPNLNTDDDTLVVVATSTSSTSTKPTDTTSTPQTGSAPVAITSADTTTSETAASLSGTIRPNGLYTSYWFEYGTTTDLGSRSAIQNIGSGYQTLTSPGYLQSLTKNTRYYYRLVAQNTIGKAIGTTYSFQTMPGNPPAGKLPTIRTTNANAISLNQATINGEITPNLSMTSYWFEYGKTKDFGEITQIKSSGDGSAKVNVSSALTGLDSGTTYFYRLNAQNQFGTVNGLTLNFKTQGPQKAIPTVRTIDESLVTATSATLKGTVNPNGLETTYWFEYSTDTLLGSVLLKSTTHTSLAAGTATVSIQTPVSGLSAKTTYYYRAVAQNSMGITYGDKGTFKTK